ncbi:hypothetical protein BDV27DRAFT_170583 [Aspergillus caelatus]|uniref:Dystroglycan-type cadherin-like domain-containing protein n=2 Tax=Aspergillus subgen. Circumdati TaxID=2720871 RepID=A0A5N7AA47_9EURO|nr:uncharacterized protein BDV27DRAFT_170583 [Aspergillus caelatus]KAE8366692.1 hypothetical protein BDV27DRAFT_170583 [Aspergillus caelatus]KAE8412719.1 hypothetical protein BDV36DRAFT_53416 [Aspergillus pseudocaelatus]
MALIWLIILGFTWIIDAKLVSNYPINSQLPPVARVAQRYQFVFSKGTFGGSDSSTTYSLSNAPSWLRVESKSRTLFGTPGEEDEGTVKFDLVASDKSESASMEVTLIVTEDDGPRPGKPLLPQLEAIAATSAPSTILIHSGDAFDISFDQDTFTNTRPSTVYYGTSPDNAPLPSWVGFDQSNLRFSGVAPNSGPQTFTFSLVASDVAGFSAAAMKFDMTVSPHILSFNQSVQTFFVSRGEKFTSPRFKEALRLDGREPAGADLTDIQTDSPSWLEFDNTTISFKGTPPVDVANENITISVTDKYQDIARLIISLQYSQFFHDIAECDAVIGSYFYFVFDNTVLTDDSVQLEVDLGNQLPWLQYNTDNKTLYGLVPADFSPDKYTVKLTAHKGTADDTKKFAINILDEGSSAGQGTDESTGSKGIHGKKAGIIAISVVIPFAFLTSLLLLFCCWRRKRRASTHEEEQLSKEKVPYSNGPELPSCQPYEETIQCNLPKLTRATPEPSSNPPKLELGPLWDTSPLDDSYQGRPIEGRKDTLSASTIDWDIAPLKVFEPEKEKQIDDAAVPPKRLSFQNSPPMRRRATTNSRKREPLKPIQPRRSLKRNSVHSSKSRRYSKRSSGISSVSSGLPVRLSGAGHGAGGFGPPGHGIVRVSWQNTHASFQSDEGGVGNLAPLFPRPPPRARGSVDLPKRMSLRTIEPDTLTISEADSLEAFVHSRAKNRNSSNPMFSGQFGRRTSSGLRALERARSTASRTDTINSSSYYDDYRRSIHERPWSTAMSASIYTDDNRQSTYLESLSEESLNVRPLASMARGLSQSSLAQNYSEAIAPLPRLLSELSLASARHAEPRGVNDDLGVPQHIDENQVHGPGW